MWANNLAPEQRVEGGERSEVMLAREDVHKAGGRERHTFRELNFVAPAWLLLLLRSGED